MFDALFLGDGGRCRDNDRVDEFFEISLKEMRLRPKVALVVFGVA
jgi:hypothetical protein